jgi:2-polyprenyl-6-methoxyphenol hydroxylase-like FAD-dependent oxidoreductase
VLHGTLMEAVGPAALRLGSRAVGFTAEPRGVALALEGGATRRGRILVGADGVQSAIRRALHPDEPAPRPSGLLAVRGLARGARALLADLGSAIYYGTGWEAGTVRAGGDDVYWFVSIRIERAGEGEGEGEGAAGDPRAPLAPILDSLHAPFRDMIAATDVRDLRADVLLEREPLAAWGGGAATLLGDAAHPMLPHAGQGAAQAIEDAVALGEAMAAATDPESGLRAYERARIPRTSAVVRLARSNARIGTLDNPLACALRNLAIRLAPERLILKRQIDVAQPGRES